jgi:multiple sugar transport system substrate-binding protein
MTRHAAEMQIDNIYPVLLPALGNYQGRRVAFPLARYANVLAYRKDLYEAAGSDTSEDDAGACRRSV